MKASRRGRFTLLGLGALGLMLLASLWLSGYLPLTCLSYDLTGYYCPGCGSGRMVHGGGRLEITFWVVMMALAGIFGILRNLPQFWMLAPGGLL